jgi:hypothetical protein
MRIIRFTIGVSSPLLLRRTTKPEIDIAPRSIRIVWTYAGEMPSVKRLKSNTGNEEERRDFASNSRNNESVRENGPGLYGKSSGDQA